LADPIPRKNSLAAGPTKSDDVVTIEPIRPSRLAASGPHSPAAVQQEAECPRPKASTPAAVQPTPANARGSCEPKILKRADARPRRIDDQLRFQRMSSEGYEPPPLALLDAPERQKVEVDEETLKKNSLLVEKKLRDFDVEGRVIAIHPGPVITMYEFEPAAGTKVSKIAGLQDDLSLTLGGRSVRVIPHLPGKAAVGIEIPNSDREIVWLKDTLSSPQFHKAQTNLPLALGASTSGHPVIADLTKMPHLLVAGATGSGKSVAINAFITSIISKSSPADVRFILVDPKMLELSIYDGIPHLLLPVVTKPKPAVAAMRWAIREMERRYRLMADTGTRNLLGYNEKIRAGQVELLGPEEAASRTEQNPEAVIHTGTIPYIVIIIDELADLMMTSSQDMEEAITRLAQMARAAGIHLILATQRPSVDVITGLIKANFPARIAFKVTARHDSRTILDGIGAETLLGNGDMLFMTPQGGNLLRIHGCFITDSDISRVVSHLKTQGEPVYDDSITAEPEGQGPNGEFEEGDDELYAQAVRLVAETKQASISMVQRRLRIGYNRAARMIERMEAEGVVGPAEGSRPRQVLAGAPGS
ncbi:MAG TPA: DNA translocase FtsK, partial [bacterium]|nr:DNA translocase FtsK [bacterium]